MNELRELCATWQQWAATADRSEDGWQSYYPRWAELMSAACAAMVDEEARGTLLPQVELCWRISEETEDLADCARERVQDCWPFLVELAGSVYSEVRWQVYSVLAEGGPGAEALLRNGLSDADAYCRRRALLALGQLRPPDLADLKRRFLQDPDPYMRQAAASLEA